MRALNKLRALLSELSDQKQSRVEIGEDRFGNKYYQYYSFLGLPTSRECQYIDWTTISKFRDNAYYNWLRKYEDFPPTEEELRL